MEANDRIMVPPDKPAYRIRRVWLTKEEEAAYYYGFANEGLWPLCNIAHTRPVFGASDWEHYRTVNQRFAQAVVQESRTENLRPRDQITNMAWDTATADYDPHSDPTRTRDVVPPQHCVVCHR